MTATSIQLLGPSSYSRRSYVGPNIRSLEVDADASAPNYPRVVYDWNPGNAEAFNLNPVGGAAASYHGGRVIGYLNGTLTLQPDWVFYVQHHFPQRVVINNAGQAASYPSSCQYQDRIIQLDAKGWYGVSLRLRVIDPPDLSAYAPNGGWPHASEPPWYLAENALPVLPYEGNDNRGTTDYGLSNSPNGPWNTTVWLRPGYDNIPQDQTDIIHFYLKVPDRYAGDNFQVEVTKCRFDGTTLPQRVAGLSAVYTSWKRVFVEADKMFRRGGVLYSSAAAGSNQIVIYDWHDTSHGDAQPVESGDTVVVFDTSNTAETGGETRTVTNVADGPVSGTKTLTLDAALTKNYIASNYTSSTPPQPTFANRESAGIGVTSSCSKCYFETDLTQVEPALDDACVEYVERSAGEGAVPYVSATWFNNPINSGLLPGPMIDFNEAWFYNWYQSARTEVSSPPVPHNYFHLLGAGSSGYAGLTLVSGYEASLVFLGSIEAIRDPLNNNNPLTAQQITAFCQHTTVHELVGHQFNTNACAASLGWHDKRPAWCAQLPPAPPPDPHGCPPGSASPKNCVMWPGNENTIAQQTDGVSRFCMEDLYLGDPNAPCISTIDGSSVAPDDTTIRTNTDPQ